MWPFLFFLALSVPDSMLIEHTIITSENTKKTTITFFLFENNLINNHADFIGLGPISF